MKVLLVSYGSVGDVRPLVALGRVLRRRGLNVGVCAPPDSRDLFAAAGLRFHPLGGNVRQVMDAGADRLIGRPLAAMAPMTRILRRELDGQFRVLPPYIQAADLVVGSGLALAVPSLAEAYGVPYHYAVSIPLVLPSRCHAPLGVPWQHLPAFCNLALWRLAALLVDGTYRALLNRRRRRLGVPPLSHVMPHLTAKLILAADKELAPLPPEAPADCRQTGYWHAPTSEVLPPAVEAFLDKTPPPLYIGFGSMGDPNPRRTVDLLRRAVHRAGVRAIIQSGWAGWSFESDRECLCVSDPLPHDRLFPRVSAVVHHGGAGTIMAAARAGRPQAVVPHLLDQYYWGRRVRTLGIGPAPLPRNRLRLDVLVTTLERITGTEAMCAKARDLAVPLRRRNGARDAAGWLIHRAGG